MAITTDTVALNDWEAIGNIDEIASGKRRNTRLLGQDIIAEMDGDRPRVFEANANGGMGREHPAQVLYGHVWTTLGTPVKPPLDMPEFLEDGRRLISCGAVTVRASPLRIVENFLDMSFWGKSPSQRFPTTNSKSASPTTNCGRRNAVFSSPRPRHRRMTARSANTCTVSAPPS